MSKVLYRKYRPARFKQIVSQDIIVNTLIGSILSDSISHAYLFCGPRGCGKTTMARIMAKAVNCLNFKENSDVCNECDNCKSIDVGVVDVLEMDAASNRGIEEIKIIKDSVNFMPSFLKKKIYIIDEAHMLTREAFNALLKTLEEPPEHVIFILATTEVNKLPQTILSRVTRFDFNLGDKEGLIEKLSNIVNLEGFVAEEGVLELIFKYSGGSFRDSESLLSKVLLSVTDSKVTMSDLKKVIGFSDESMLDSYLEYLVSKDIDSLIMLIKDLEKSGVNLSVFIDQFIKYLSNLILSNSENYFTYSRIANYAIEIKDLIKDFSSKSSIVILKTLELFNNEDAKLVVNSKLNNTQVKLLPSNNANQTSQIESNTYKAKLPEQIISSTISKEKTFNLKLFLQEVATQSQRLSKILESSIIEFTGNELKIKTDYKLNLVYMSKKESRDIIIASLKTLTDNDFGISFNIIETNESDNLKNKDQKLEQNDNTTKTKINDKIDNVLIDNSSLVENLF